MSFAVKLFRNLLVGKAIESKQNDLGALGRSGCLDPGLDNVLLSFSDDNLGGHSSHESSSDGVLIFHRIIWQQESCAIFNRLVEGGYAQVGMGRFG